jgi:hypothetical protein
VTIEELCRANIFVASASAIRYKDGHNCIITKTVKEKVVQFSAPLMIPELGIVLQLSAHPSCNRSMDPIPMAFWKHAIMNDWIKAGRKIPLLNLSL